MKALKMILMVLMVLATVTAFSQVTLRPSKSAYSYTGVATDTIESHASGEWTQVIKPNKPYPVKIVYQMELERVVTTVTPPKCVIKVQGKYFDTDPSWNDVTSMTLTVPSTGGGLKADTIITLAQTSTAQPYRVIRAYIQGTAVSGKPASRVGWTKWKFFQ